tara:strand:+ start:5486 stop:5887 length:402 start_codon:yes stop_codon:yes gene_type:complete
MDIDTVLIDLSVISQLKNQDKLGVINLPGRQELVIFSGKAWFQGTYRWWKGSNRSEVLAYLHLLVLRLQRHCELFSGPVAEKTRVLTENLKSHTVSAIDGLSHLQSTYASDNHAIAQLLLISQKLLECSNQLL